MDGGELELAGCWVVDADIVFQEAVGTAVFFFLCEVVEFGVLGRLEEDMVGWCFDAGRGNGTVCTVGFERDGWEGETGGRGWKYN